MMIRCGAAALVLLAPCAARAGQNTWCEPELLGELGGHAIDIAVEGDIAVVANASSGVMVLGVADPAHPVLLGQVDLGGLPALIERVELDDGIAYAFGDSTLWVVSVADPGDPTVLASIEAWDYGNDIELKKHGDAVYIAAVAGNLKAIDVSNPAAPKIASDFYTIGEPVGIAIRGDALYLMDKQLGLQVYDITDPLAPVYVDTLVVVRGLLDMAQVGDIALATIDGPLHFAILDLADAFAPQLIEFVLFDTFDDFHRLVLEGGTLFASADSDLYSFDVQDPLNPAIGAITQLKSWIQNMTGDAGNLFLAANGTTTVVGTGGGAAPEVIGMFDTPGNAQRALLHGNHMFLTEDNSNGLGVYDITDAAQPLFVASVPLAAGAQALAASGDVLYIARSDLRVVDISTPEAPALLFDITIAPALRDLAVVGDVLAVLAEGSLRTYDIAYPSVPWAPATLQDTVFKESARIVLEGELAYIVGSNDGHELIIVDLSDPSAPAVLSTVALPGSSQDIAVEGGIACIGLVPEAMALVDVADPAAPVLLKVQGLPCWPLSLEFVDGELVVGTVCGSSMVFDVSTPTLPKFVGNIGLGGGGFIEVAARDGVLYTTASKTGIRTFQLACTAACGDVDASGVVDSEDIHSVLALFGCVGACGQADADGDGAVGSADLNVVLAGFGKVCGG